MTDRTHDNASPPQDNDHTNFIQTHISTIFFTADRAYKLLRPVDYPFIHLAKRSDRVETARREYELNSRFAPDVYLGLADIYEDGELADRMIVMRRLPEERRLSRLVGSPEFGDCLRQIARKVAAAHAEAETFVDAPMASSSILEANWRDNFDAIASHAGTIIGHSEFETVRNLATTYLTNRRGLFESRIRDGFFRDGHGDLIAEDIFCLDDGPRLLDCLAFDDRLRIGDVLLDIAFLVMDVHRLAGPVAARSLMRAYREFTGEQHAPSLAHHYVAYRAHVRAKIACLRSAQGDTASAELARSYHALCRDHLERGRVRLILVGGGPGVGKTTLAAQLADHFGYVHLATDDIRRDVSGTSHGDRHLVEPGTGIYTRTNVDATYTEQRREARLLLERGFGVVLDASWTKEIHRAAARSIAAEQGAELVELECTLPSATARERIERRLANPWNPSDATPEVVDYLAERRDEWPTATRLSMAPPTSEVMQSALAAIARGDEEVRPSNTFAGHWPATEAAE